MAGQREEYIWLTFGKKSIEGNYKETRENGGALIGLGHKYTIDGFVTNNFLLASNVDYPWGEYFPMDVSKINHAAFSVSRGFYRYFLNGNLIFENPLPENYSGGYIGFGTNCINTVISNIRINGKEAAFQKCGYLRSVTDSRAGIFSPEVFYSVKDNCYKRTFNGAGNWNSNVAMFLGDIYYGEFTLDFDFEYRNYYSPDDEKKTAVKDPFGKYPIGPYPQSHWVDWCKTSKLTGTVWNKDSFEIKTELLGFERSIFISLPDIGGVRFSSEPPKSRTAAPEELTGIFEPESSLEIIPNDENVITAADGTRVQFVSNGEFWHIDVYNSSNKLLYSLNQWNFSFADDRGCVKQYRIELPLDENELVCGSGERFGSFDQHGKRVTFWNTDPCYHWSQSSEGYDLWRGYKNVPLIHTGRGCSLFFNTTCNGYGDFGYTEETEILFEFDDYRLDFYLWAGSIEENLIKYTDLTGKQLLPPEWAFHYMAGGSNGFWKCPGLPADRNAYMTLLNKMIEGYEELGTKPSALYCEGLVGKDFEAYKLAEEWGTRILCWQCADAPVNIRRQVRPDADDSRLPVAKRLFNPQGQPFYFIDFPHPDRLGFMQDMYGEYINNGLSGGMVDFAELVPIDAVFSNGLCGDRMHNFFSYWYARAYYELYSSLRGDDFLCYIRGGCAGSQKWLCTWCGDQYASFDGLKQQLACGLSISASGFSVWGGDLGGLCGTPTREVFIRGTQFSTFQPLMRAGGDSSKQPWDYGEKAVEVYKTHYWLRENIASLIYSYAIRSHKTGIPITTTMAMAFGNTVCSEFNESQYMLGDNILFAPVLEEGAATKKLYFPKGKWYSLFENTVINGECELEVSAPIEYSPAFVRSGAVIPVTVNEKLQLMQEMNGKRIDALLITPAEECRKEEYYFNTENSVVFTSEALKDGFCVNISGKHSFSDAILPIAASEITVNGAEVTYRDSLEDVLKLGGFTVSGGKTLVHLDVSFEIIQVKCFG